MMVILTSKRTLRATFKMILSYSLKHKLFLPHDIMVYTHGLIRRGVVEDHWRDWVFFWKTPYSWRMDNDIYNLYMKGYLRKLCVGNICGFYTLTNKSIHYLKKSTL
ncbi:MAG: hypothetical protein QXT03_01500 [Desulfurococcaceae archaeon]